MAHIVAIANQKGGVGKTTTAVNLAASLAVAERRTLLLDADPQGNATSGVGIAKHELQLSLYDSLVEGRTPHEIVLPVPSLPHLSVLPATQDLVGAELQLVERPHREAALRSVLDPLQPDYDYIVVDCPPSLGLLTLNVLASANTVLIPIQCEYYGLEGISQLLNTVRLVQQNFNPGLAISGVLLTMYDARLNLCRQVAEDAKEYFGAKMFVTPIPRNVRLAEAPSFGKPILLYDVQSVGAKSYLAVAQELIRRIENGSRQRPRAAEIQPLEAAAALAAGQAESVEQNLSADGATHELGSEETGSEGLASEDPGLHEPSLHEPSLHEPSLHEPSSDESGSRDIGAGEAGSHASGSEGDASAGLTSEASPLAVHAVKAAAPDADRAEHQADQPNPSAVDPEHQSHAPEVTT